MTIHAVTHIIGSTDVSAAGTAMKTLVQPLMLSLVGIATLVSVFFLITGGIQYMTSKGHPDQLEHAKRVVRNALVGLVIVIAAGTLTSILSHAYSAGTQTSASTFPSLQAVQPADNDGGITAVLLKAITGLFKNIIETAAKPFFAALDYFTKSTALMGDNSAVFQLWSVVVGITDALFVLILALMGFHVMSASSLGFDELEFKHLLPKIIMTFLLINTSIFAIDAIISVSNGMITALQATFGDTSVFKVLTGIADQAGSMGLVALMIMVVFMVLAVILLVYYVMRLVILYLGAILSPLVALLLLVPGFKDFAITAIKTYITTVFVLFVHVIILLLAASIFAGMVSASPGKAIDAVMASVVGVATLVTLLKTQGVMMQMSYVSVGPKAIRKLGGQFMHGVSYTASQMKKVQAPPTKNRKETA